MCKEYRESYKLHLGSLRIKTSLTQALSISSLFFLVTIYTFNTTFHNHLFYGWSHIKIVYISIFLLISSLFFLVTIYTFNTTFHNHLFYGWSHIKIVYISIFLLMDVTVIQPNNSLLNCFEIHLHLVSTEMLMILVKNYTKTTSKWKNCSSKGLRHYCLLCLKRQKIIP